MAEDGEAPPADDDAAAPPTPMWLTYTDGAALWSALDMIVGARPISDDPPSSAPSTPTIEADQELIRGCRIVYRHKQDRTLVQVSHPQDPSESTGIHVYQGRLGMVEDVYVESLALLEHYLTDFRARSESEPNAALRPRLNPEDVPRWMDRIRHVVRDTENHEGITFRQRMEIRWMLSWGHCHVCMKQYLLSDRYHTQDYLPHEGLFYMAAAATKWCGLVTRGRAMPLDIVRGIHEALIVRPCNRKAEPAAVAVAMTQSEALAQAALDFAVA